MSRLLYSVSMSLDGFVAGPDQSVDNPLGVGGLLLHEWMRDHELAGTRLEQVDVVEAPNVTHIRYRVRR